MQREILVSETQNPNFMICHPIDSSDQRKTDNKPWNKQTNKKIRTLLFSGAPSLCAETTVSSLSQCFVFSLISHLLLDLEQLHAFKHKPKKCRTHKNKIFLWMIFVLSSRLCQQEDKCVCICICMSVCVSCACAWRCVSWSYRPLLK